MVLSEIKKYKLILQPEKMQRDEDKTCYVQLRENVSWQLPNEAYQLKPKLAYKWNQWNTESIVEWKAKKLALNSNDCPQILKQLNHISFPCLKKIVLWFNKIESIEGLSRVYMPNLSELNLASNKLSDISDLRKMSIKNINKIVLGANQAMSGGFLPELCCPELRELVLELVYSELLMDEIRWALKLEARQLTHLYISSKYRIREIKVYQSIKRKYGEESPIIGQKEANDSDHFD